MECREALELLNDEIDGRLGAADAARLAGHVASCAACVAARSDLASMRAAFRAVPREPAPTGFRAGVMTSLPRGRVRSLPMTLGWLAAAAAVFVIAVSLLPNREPSAEREVAQAARRGDAAGPVADASAAPPVTAPAEPVAPPRPPVGFASGRGARHDAAEEKSDADTGASALKAQTSDTAKAPQPRPTEADAPKVPSDDAPRGGVAAEKDVAGTLAPLPAVRYVVFRDAAAAERFARSLAADGGRRKKDTDRAPPPAASAPAPAPAPAPALPAPLPAGGRAGGGGGGGSGAAAPPAKPLEGAENLVQREDVVKQASFLTRRVVARAPIAAPVADADIAALASAAGGTLVPQDAATQFAALLDTAAEATEEARTRRKAEAAVGDKVAKEKRRDDDKPSAAGAPPAAAAPAVVVVIVVLEPPPGAK